MLLVKNLNRDAYYNPKNVVVFHRFSIILVPFWRPGGPGDPPGAPWGKPGGPKGPKNSILMQKGAQKESLWATLGHLWAPFSRFFRVRVPQAPRGRNFGSLRSPK